MESRALYRTLARLLRKHLGGVAKSRPWLQHAADEFRGSAALSGADVDSRLQLLRDYVFLIENTHAHWVRTVSKLLKERVCARQRPVIWLGDSFAAIGRTKTTCELLRNQHST